ncbi:MAG: reverse transcriptase family protein [Polyangiales bacterium]
MHALAHALSLAFLDGPWALAPLVERGAAVLGGRPPWLRAVARRALATFAIAPHTDHADAVTEVIRSAPSFRSAQARDPRVARRWPAPETVMLPRRHGWTLPEIATPGALAAWLGVTPAQLEGYADLRGINRGVSNERVKHYRVRWVAKSAGGWRALEAPKDHLKALQRKVLDEIVAQIPAHPAAHGFVRGRSALTHARAHAGRRTVLRLDLADFFASVHATLLRAIFREAAYPDAVAARLAGICTTRTARGDQLRRPDARVGDALWKRLREPHLPQGAPTSPALANLALYRVDARLHGLALAFGATYTRYADDLTFSCDGPVTRLAAAVERVVRDEGFALRPDKTRAMPSAQRQRVAGVVVNEGVAVARDEYDRLRATLHRCATRGVAYAQIACEGDPRAHLAGRVAWVASTSAKRGEKLRALLDRIAW